MTEKRVKIEVVSLETGEVVHEIQVSAPVGSRMYEKTLSGIERKVDMTRFYTREVELGDSNG